MTKWGFKELLRAAIFAIGVRAAFGDLELRELGIADHWASFSLNRPSLDPIGRVLVYRELIHLILETPE
jgi:hypothetical protein